MTLATDLQLDLQKRRHDLAGLKHSPARYQEILNQAIREVPRLLWRLDTDTQLVTEAEVRRYTLTSTPGLTKHNQITGVFIEDSAGNDLEIGRCMIEDNLGVLTLILDEDPPDGRTVTICYERPWDELDWDPQDSTDLDREWLLAKAMTLLLMEADPDLEDPGWIAMQLQLWDTRRQVREQTIKRQPRSRKARTQSWAAVRGKRQGGEVAEGIDYFILE